MPFFIPLLITLTSMSASAEIFTWTDAKGVTHFSEEKPEGQEAQSVTVTEQMPATPTAATTANTAQPKAPETEQPKMDDADIPKEGDVAEIAAPNSDEAISDEVINANNIDQLHPPKHQHTEQIKEKIKDSGVTKTDIGEIKANHEHSMNAEATKVDVTNAGLTPSAE